jgi:hypothetical protein
VKNGHRKNRSREHCHMGTLPLTSTGYPKSLRLPPDYVMEGQNLELGATTRPQDYSWSAGQIVLMYHGKLPPSRTAEASHLCNHPWCIRPRHLCWEEPRNNYARKNCNTWTKCPCVCGQEFNPCRHGPKCLSMKKCDCKAHTAIREGRAQ